MSGYWKAKPVQICNVFNKLEDVILCFENTHKTLSVIWGFLFVFLGVINFFSLAGWFGIFLFVGFEVFIFLFV